MFWLFGHYQVCTFPVGCTAHPLHQPVFTMGIFCQSDISGCNASTYILVKNVILFYIIVAFFGEDVVFHSWLVSSYYAVVQAVILFFVVLGCRVLFGCNLVFLFFTV
jgi:hypothetical protein